MVFNRGNVFPLYNDVVIKFFKFLLRNSAKYLPCFGQRVFDMSKPKREVAIYPNVHK